MIRDMIRVGIDRRLFRARQKRLTVTDDNILLHGTNVVMPELTRGLTEALAHEGHQGTVKRKELLRPKLSQQYVNVAPANVHVARADVRYANRILEKVKC